MTLKNHACRARSCACVRASAAGRWRHVFACLYLYVYVSVGVCVCVYVYAYVYRCVSLDGVAQKGSLTRRVLWSPRPSQRLSRGSKGKTTTADG